MLKLAGMSEDERKENLIEIHWMKKLRHPNIIRLYECYNHNDLYYIITELCDGQDLLNEMEKKSQEKGLSANEVRIIIK